MKTFVSNHLEVLAQVLKQQLFHSSKDPLERSWVIVPNQAVKQYLLCYFVKEQNFASELKEGIVAGVTILTWHQAMKSIFYLMPTEEELFLKIELALEQIEEVRSYLKGESTERKNSLSAQLAKLFLHYLSQPEEKLRKWLSTPGWQPLLWSHLFSEGFPWTKERPLQGAVYLFHPHLILPYQWRVLKKMDVTCFLFSPCGMYWGDLKTLQEQKSLLRQCWGREKEALFAYFQQDHPLLANWGKRGRALFHLFEGEEEVSCYKNPESQTLLSLLQREFLTLMTVDHKSADHSIQIHSAASKWREVEIVWEILQRLSVEPREIKIFAPEISNYVSAIELVFKMRGGAFPYAIEGLEARVRTPLIQGVEDLLRLPRLKFSTEGVKNLLLSRPFLQKFDFTPEEVRLTQEWIDAARISCDLEGEHPRTWKAGLQRILEALVVEDADFLVDFSQIDLLNKWMTIVELFYSKLNLLQSDHQLSLLEWSCFLRELIEDFFIIDLEENPWIQEIQNWGKLRVEGVFLFSTIESLLERVFSRPTNSINRGALQAVRFTSLAEGAVTPCKVIVLMGMEESSFPRREGISSLQQFPSGELIERDKYLFLEAISHAQEELIITYIHLHPEDGKIQNSSPLVEELRRYLGTISSIQHPASPFDPFYFQEGGMRSFSHFHYQALKYQHEEKKEILEGSLSLKSSHNWNIGKFRQLAHHPLRFFFENKLGIRFDKKKESLSQEFLLSSYDLWGLRRESLKFSKEALLWQMKKRGAIPLGSFGEVMCEKIHRELDHYHEMLKKLAIPIGEIYDIDFKRGCRTKIQVDDRRWIYPPLRVSLPSNKELLLEGRIEGVFRGHLLYHGEDHTKDLLKAWPLYLFLLQLDPSARLMLTQSGKVSRLQVDQPQEALLRYLEYAEKASHSPSPLMPKWANFLFKGEKRVELQDEIVQWAETRGLLPTSDASLREWIPYLRGIFDELI